MAKAKEQLTGEVSFAGIFSAIKRIKDAASIDFLDPRTVSVDGNIYLASTVIIHVVDGEHFLVVQTPASGTIMMTGENGEPPAVTMNDAGVLADNQGDFIWIGSNFPYSAEGVVANIEAGDDSDDSQEQESEQEQEEAPPKRGRGRPPGSTNKPKVAPEPEAPRRVAPRVQVGRRR